MLVGQNLPYQTMSARFAKCGACWSVCLILLLGTIGARTVLADSFSLTDLNGQSVQGDLMSMNRQSIVLSVDGAEKSFPRADVVEITQQVDNSKLMPAVGQMEVRLVGGSILKLKSLKRTGEICQLVTGDGDTIEVPAKAISQVLVSGLRSGLEERWNELASSSQTTDLLIVKKNDNLDFVSGVIGDIDESGVGFLLGERSAKVPWDRIFGLIFLRPKSSGKVAGVTCETVDGQELKAENVTLEGNQFHIQLSSDTVVLLPRDQIQRIDFSAGKIKSLSDLAPVRVDIKPFFDREWKPGFDRNTHGGPLSIGGKTYRKGISLHSHTEMTYRLAGAYTLFRCTAGLDQSINPRRGDVNLTIKGDGKVLFEQNFSTSSSTSQYGTPVPIELNLNGVNDLTFIVDYGTDQIDIGDNLNLVDARLIR